jgi:regulator of sigma E protease
MNPEQNSSSETASWQRTLFSWLLTVVAIAVFAYLKPEWAKTALVFIITLSVLVFVHEWGHFQFARWAGMKVNRFAIGFPPFIYTKRKNGVDYSIGALPIGGMVDISGLGSEEEMVNTAKGAEVTAPVRRPHMPHGQKEFQDASLGWRFWTLFAGPLMNFIYAIVIFVGVYSFVGKPEPYAVLEKVKAGYPAEKAGIRAGDRIIAINGQRALYPDEIANQVAQKKGQPVDVTVERGGKNLTLSVKPVMENYSGSGAKPYLGVQFDQTTARMNYVKTDFVSAVKMGFTDSAKISLAILDTIKRLVTRDLSKEEAEGIGGPVKIAQVTGQVAQQGFIAALLFSAMLSVNLGLMNLLPLPALDGGRILFLGYELVMRRPFDPKKESFVHMAGMVMLLALMLLITFRDILHIGRG